MNRNWLNYWVDVIIGMAFLLSTVSGLVFLLPQDPLSSNGVLGLSFQLWNQLHTWASLTMIAGVGAHLVLHWRWIIAMTKRMLSPGHRPKAAGATPSGALNRRQFLYFGGIAAVATALAATGYKTIFANPAAASQDAASGVACPFGRVNDPYPGRCRFYVDSNGDGFCDYSATGSGSDTISSSSSTLGRRHGAGWRQP